MTYVNEILSKTLLPFRKKVFPHGLRFQQDNDHKHTSMYDTSGNMCLFVSLFVKTGVGWGVVVMVWGGWGVWGGMLHAY